MFTYKITLTNGRIVTIESAGDPTDHPSFFNRVVSVETLCESPVQLELVGV
jgi:hypothetical protein